MTTHLPICGPTRKRPRDAESRRVAALLPGGHFGGEDSLIAIAAKQALAGKDADLDLGHIKPAWMFRCVVVTVQTRPLLIRGRDV